MVLHSRTKAYITQYDYSHTLRSVILFDIHLEFRGFMIYSHAYASHAIMKRFVAGGNFS